MLSTLLTFFPFFWRNHLSVSIEVPFSLKKEVKASQKHANEVLYCNLHSTEMYRQKQRTCQGVKEKAHYLVVYQVVKCNYTPNERRKIYYQHHIICFHCKRTRKLVSSHQCGNQSTNMTLPALPAKALINSRTLRFGSRLNTSCKE